jgi:hypothetical protein
MCDAIIAIDWLSQLIAPLKNKQLIAPAWYNSSLVRRIVQQFLLGTLF